MVYQFQFTSKIDVFKILVYSKIGKSNFRYEQVSGMNTRMTINIVTILKGFFKESVTVHTKLVLGWRYILNLCK